MNLCAQHQHTGWSVFRAACRSSGIGCESVTVANLMAVTFWECHIADIHTVIKQGAVCLRARWHLVKFSVLLLMLLCVTSIITDLALLLFISPKNWWRYVPFLQMWYTQGWIKQWHSGVQGLIILLFYKAGRFKSSKEVSLNAKYLSFLFWIALFSNIWSGTAAGVNGPDLNPPLDHRLTPCRSMYLIILGCVQNGLETCLAITILLITAPCPSLMANNRLQTDA